MYTLMVIGLSVLAGSIWLRIWNEPDIIIILGIAIIVFGYWWKSYWYWYYRSTAYSIESLEKMEKKRLLGEQLTAYEKSILFAANDGAIVVKVTSKIGIVVIAIGILLKIFF